MRAWLLILAASGIGAAAGVGGYTFLYARGFSYLTDRPEACANCHIMRGNFDGWLHSSHHQAAACNDCHTPSGFVGKWFTKGYNGFWHSYYFTFGNFPEPIRITARDRGIVEERCRQCHASVILAIGGTSCLPCHSSVGHME
jgi:cytochrome c nitrite reductase small subunit